MIEGVVVRPLTVHQDDRGSLFEVVHNYEMPGGSAPYRKLLGAPEGRLNYGELSDAVAGRFGQVYVVRNPVRGVVRAFHKHSSLWDYFTVVSGVAKFCLVKSPPGETEIHVLSGDSPKLMIVPPGVFHGWMSLTDNVVLVSVGSELYRPDKPDEIRVPPDSFDADFGGSPWVIRGR